MGYPATQQPAFIGHHGNTCHPDSLPLYSTSVKSDVMVGGGKGGAVARPPFFSLSDNFLLVGKFS